MKISKKIIVASIVAASAWSTSVLAASEVQFWHAFTGRLGELVAEQVESFNGSQSDYTVVATHKGNYSETLNAGIAAFRAKEQPHVLMVFEVGTATMMGAKGGLTQVHTSVRLRVTTPQLMAKCCRYRLTPQHQCFG